MKIVIIVIIAIAVITGFMFAAVSMIKAWQSGETDRVRIVAETFRQLQTEFAEKIGSGHDKALLAILSIVIIAFCCGCYVFKLFYNFAAKAIDNQRQLASIIEGSPMYLGQIKNRELLARECLNIQG